MFIFKDFKVYLFLFILFIFIPFKSYSDEKFNLFINNISNDAQKKGISTR